MNGLKYAWDVTKAVLVARSQQLGLFYDRRFDCDAGASRERALSSRSSITRARTARRSELVPAGARVLDLGCAGGYVGATLLRQRRGCRVTGVDRYPLGRAWSWMPSSVTISTTACRR